MGIGNKDKSKQMTWLTDHEATVRLVAFAGVLVVMMGLETMFPRKVRVASRWSRWRTNGLLVVLDTLIVRLLIPVAAVGVASWANSNSLGILSLVTVPPWLTIIMAFILLDGCIYAQHVMTHHIPVLWALHKVHHTDRDIDVTTGVRFHPLEIVFSMVYKFLIIILLGPPVVAVILFEVVLNASAMFNHANVRLPLWLDRLMRVVIVTPDMHRVHHSVEIRETNHNFGFFFSVWDRLFQTYTAQPKAGHDNVIIGLEDYQTRDPNELLWSLTIPFKKSRAPKRENTSKTNTS